MCDLGLARTNDPRRSENSFFSRASGLIRAIRACPDCTFLQSGHAL